MYHFSVDYKLRQILNLILPYSKYIRHYSELKCSAYLETKVNADNIIELLTSCIDPVVMIDVDNVVLCCLETEVQQKDRAFLDIEKNYILGIYFNKKHVSRIKNIYSTIIFIYL